MIVRVAGATVAALVLAAATASAGAAPAAPAADPPRPSPPDAGAAEQASDANFDPATPHRGFLIGASIGPAMQLGFRVKDSSGTGPGLSLRIGTAATRRLSWLLEIASTGYRHEQSAPTMVGDTPKPAVNSSALLAVGAQYYLRDVIWIRGGAGLATFTLRSGGADNQVFFGAGALGGAGFDVLRRGRFALSLELTMIGSRYADGFIGGGFTALGASWY